MKIKHYTFTDDEMLVVRDALVEQYVRLRDHMESMPKSDQSPRLRKMVKTLEALKEQLKDDCLKL